MYQCWTCGKIIISSGRIEIYIATVRFKTNFMWIFGNFLKIANTPTWVGFNSQMIVDNFQKQRVSYFSYLTTINLTPRNTVVVQTMVQSQKIAEKYMQVTYDLACKGRYVEKACF